MDKNNICSIAECGKPMRGRCGWRNAHYKRFRRHGDPIGGRIAWGEAMRYFREEVLPYVGEDCLFWPYKAGGNGYGQLRDGDKMRLVHRMVCERVNGPSPTPEHEAAHSCGNGHLGCVAPGHLSWKTPAENRADKLIHGTHNRGERNTQAKLTECDVREILRLSADGMRHREIADKFGVKPSNINAIIRRRTWRHLNIDESNRGLAVSRAA